MKKERIGFDVVEKFIPDNEKSNNNRKQILFEYCNDDDTIYFSNPIQLQNRTITSIKNCSKLSTWIPYIHPDDVHNVLEVFKHKEGSMTEFRCKMKDIFLWYRISLMRSSRAVDARKYLLGSFDCIQEEKQYVSQEEQLVEHVMQTSSFLFELMKKVNIVDELMSLWTRNFEQLKRGVEQQGLIDPMTNLNHIGEFIRISKDFISKKEDMKIYAVVSLDFIHFKYVNRQCGIETADQILYDYARELEQFETAICVGREFADRFVMLIEGNDIHEMKQAVTRMNKLFIQKQAQKLHGFKLYIVAGIYQLHDSDDLSFALDQARYARKNVKNIYETNTCIYKEEMLQRVNRKLDIINSQENALENHEFEVYLQPKIDLQKNQIVGAEALLRWNRMDGTRIFPDEFIPIFEQNGFIIPIDFYVYETVCQLIRKWQVQLNRSIPISVNVSRAHLSDSNFADEIESLVKQYQIPNELLELELTETMVLDCVEDAVDMMKRLQELGFVISIDDFGSGYSSLNLLKDFKMNILKIDKEFFRRGDLQEQDKIIVTNIIHMAKQLNMKVLSEGVETTMQSEFLRDCCCDMAQGYLYAKPMPVAEFEKYMMEYSM